MIRIKRRKGKTQPKVSVQRTRLPAAIRGSVLRIVVGPSDMIEHDLPLDTTNCWLVQYEGHGYRDWDRCWDKRGIESLLGLFRAAYPNVHISWLKELKS